MSTYCFMTDQKGLFLEAGIRAWRMAILDFPRFKSEEERQMEAQRLPDVLRCEVCCIPPDDSSYQLLIISAWLGFYAVAPHFGERLMAQAVLRVKSMPPSEGVAFLHRVFSKDFGTQAVLDSVYGIYLSMAGGE